MTICISPLGKHGEGLWNVAVECLWSGYLLGNLERTVRVIGSIFQLYRNVWVVLSNSDFITWGKDWVAPCHLVVILWKSLTEAYLCTDLEVWNGRLCVIAKQ